MIMVNAAYRNVKANKIVFYNRDGKRRTITGNVFFLLDSIAKTGVSCRIGVSSEEEGGIPG